MDRLNWDTIVRSLENRAVICCCLAQKMPFKKKVITRESHLNKSLILYLTAQTRHNSELFWLTIVPTLGTCWWVDPSWCARRTGHGMERHRHAGARTDRTLWRSCWKWLQLHRDLRGLGLPSTAGPVPPTLLERGSQRPDSLHRHSGGYQLCQTDR